MISCGEAKRWREEITERENRMESAGGREGVDKGEGLSDQVMI